ncbi:MAG TPA: aminotransferase class V-fold PLP-dependent enzyme [Bdellovibrio sp.]
MTSTLRHFQDQFAQGQGLIHLNNAGLSPICRPAHDKVKYWAERFYNEGFWTDKDYMANVYESRQALARLIGCAPSEIAWFQSAAGGINQFAFGIGLNAGDEVLMWDQEYSSHLYPWKAACDQTGAVLKVLKSESHLETPTEKYLEALTSKTKVAAFSWVQFSSGARMDTEHVIKECKKRGILVFVDIAQGLGIHECKLWDWGVDGVAGGSHKWLVSPVGVGYLAIRQSLALKLKPRTIGAYTYGTCDDPSDFACEPKTDATKFEAGSKQVLEITALGASCELIHNVGVSVIESEALRLAQILRLGLHQKGYKLLNPFGLKAVSPMVNFVPTQEKSLTDITEKLSQNKINFALRGGGIRLSPHAFNTESEIATVLSLL